MPPLPQHQLWPPRGLPVLRVSAISCITPSRSALQTDLCSKRQDVMGHMLMNLRMVPFATCRCGYSRYCRLEIQLLATPAWEHPPIMDEAQVGVDVRKADMYSILARFWLESYLHHRLASAWHHQSQSTPDALPTRCLLSTCRVVMCARR